MKTKPQTKSLHRDRVHFDRVLGLHALIAGTQALSENMLKAPLKETTSTNLVVYSLVCSAVEVANRDITEGGRSRAARLRKLGDEYLAAYKK